MFARKWLWIPLLVLLLAAAGFVVWAETPLGPMPEATAAMQSDTQVTVEDSPWIVFRPAGSEQSSGLIFYPGGRVDARSYAPAARQIAAQGFLVVIVPMPLNLAVFSPGEAEQVIAAFPAIQHWAVGGHSLGGAMAANFAYNWGGRRPPVEGLALWASYPAASDDLSGSGLSVLSIYGSVDGLATGGKIEASRPLLPASTCWVVIQGGNHAGFGWYGPQPGDNPATISRQVQQEQVVQATVDLLNNIALGTSGN